MELSEVLKIVLPIITGLTFIVYLLSRWIIKSIGNQIRQMDKEVLLNKSDIYAIDDTLDAVLKDTEYTDRKMKKKNEIVVIYKAKGLLD